MGAAGQSQKSLGMDPITFEIVRNSLKAVCAEMALVVSKTAYSVPINEGKDFAGTVCDAQGRLVTQSEYDLPAFVGLSMFSTKEVVRQIGLETVEPDDIYWINRPLRGEHPLQRYALCKTSVLPGEAGRVCGVDRALERRGRGGAGIG